MAEVNGHPVPGAGHREGQPTEPSAPARSPAVAIAVVLLIAGYSAVLAAFGSGAAAASDASGYLNAARLLAAGRVSTPVRLLPGVPADTLQPRDLAPLGFKLGQRPGSLVPSYPIGLPLHLAAAAVAGGWPAAGIIVNTLAAAAALALVYLLGLRLALPAVWSAACVVLLAVFPVTFRSFTWVMSDGLATTWCLAAVYCALRGAEGRRWAVLAGVSFGIAVLVRPTSSLIIVALLLALPWRLRTIAAFVAGGLPAAVALGAFNYAAYGAVLASGYSMSASRLAWSYLASRAAHFAMWISRFLTPVPLLLLVLSIWRAVRGDRRHLVLLTWASGVVGFYVFYLNSNDAWWYLRFILPALPAVLLAAALVAWDLYRRLIESRAGGVARVAARTSLVVGVAVAVALSSWFILDGQLWRIGRGETAYPRAVAELQRRAGGRSAVISDLFSGATYFYSALPTARCDNMSAATALRLRAAARASGTALLALVGDGEVGDLRDKLPGKWQAVWRSEHTAILSLREDQSPPVGPPAAR